MVGKKLFAEIARGKVSQAIKFRRKGPRAGRANWKRKQPKKLVLGKEGGRKKRKKRLQP